MLWRMIFRKKYYYTDREVNAMIDLLGIESIEIQREEIRYFDSNSKEQIKSKICKDEFPCDEYIVMQAIYRRAFENYLNDVLDIDTLNDELKDSGYLIEPRPIEKQSWQNKNSRLDLPLMFIWSDVHIERLSEEDLSILKECIKNGEIESEELNEMVIRTYKAVFKYLEEYDDERIFGRHSSGEIYVENSSLILSLNYDFNLTGEEEGSGEFPSRSDYIEHFMEKYSKIFTDKLGFPVYIFDVPLMCFDCAG